MSQSSGVGGNPYRMQASIGLPSLKKSAFTNSEPQANALPHSASNSEQDADDDDPDNSLQHAFQAGFQTGVRMARHNKQPSTWDDSQSPFQGGQQQFIV